MAEAVGLVGSIIAIVELTHKIAIAAYSYGEAVRNAKKDLAHVKTELEALRATLEKLQKMANDVETSGYPLERWPTLMALLANDSPIATCKTRLEDLAIELSVPVDSIGARTLEQIRWPSKKKKVAEVLKNITILKDRLAEDLNIEHMSEGQKVTQIIEGISRAQDTEKVRDIVQWLSHVDPGINHEAAKKTRQEGTGEWFIRGETYTTWRETPNSFLWLYGFAGCGKTVLSSTIIDEIAHHCKNRSGHYAAYFYFSFSDQEKQKPLNMTRSILAQLVQQMPIIPHEICTFYDGYHNSSPPLANFKAFLQTTLKISKGTFIVIDALDECPNDQYDREELCSLLTEISRWELPHIHILVTSRKEEDIREGLSSIPILQSISIQNEAVDRDIRQYIRAMLEDPKLNKWPPKTQSLIEETLNRDANGMFRWVYCQFQSLKRCLSVNDVQTTLQNLPKTLDETYLRMLREIPEEYQVRAINCLRWLTFSERPLSIEELAEAAILDSGKRPNLSTHNRLSSPRYIFHILGSLVLEYQTSDNISATTATTEFRLAHFSIKEFLSSKRLNETAPSFSMVNHESHQILAKDCLLYILGYSYSAYKTSSDKDITSYPLLKYTSKYWPDHYRITEDNEDLLALAVELLSVYICLSSWVRVYSPDNIYSNPFSPELETRLLEDQIGSPIYFAASMGLRKLIDRLLDLGNDINTKAGHFHGALQAACITGKSLEFIEYLISKGAQYNTPGGYYGCPLQAAAFLGNEDILKLLLDIGADTNIIAGKYGTALQVAVFGRTEGITRILLEAGADTNIIAGKCGTALLAAVIDGTEGIVSMLLEAGADTNIVAGEFGTALHAAAFSRTEGIIRILLEAGADTNIIGGVYGTALLAAVIYRTEGIVSMLLEAGADTNIVAGKYGTALLAAVIYRTEGIVSMLLKAGADTNIITGEYGTALHAAAFSRGKEMVEVLLENRADINIVGGKYGTVLRVAIARWQRRANHCRHPDPKKFPIIRLLLDAGAKVDDECRAILNQESTALIRSASSIERSRRKSMRELAFGNWDSLEEELMESDNQVYLSSSSSSSISSLGYGFSPSDNSLSDDHEEEEEEDDGLETTEEEVTDGHDDNDVYYSSSPVLSEASRASVV